jgi:hypothetical protein
MSADQSCLPAHTELPFGASTQPCPGGTILPDGRTVPFNLQPGQPAGKSRGSKLLQIALVIPVSVCVWLCAGCDVKRPAWYFDPHEIQHGKLEDIIQRFNRTPYPSGVQTTFAHGSQWAFVTSFPYRGRNMFDVYIYERPIEEGSEYTFRGMLVVHNANAESLTIDIRADDAGVAVIYDGRNIQWLAPLKPQ